MGAGNCPICNSVSRLELSNGSVSYYVSCPRCGDYSITDYAKDQIERAWQLDDAEIRHFLSTKEDPNLNPSVSLCIEVARKAADAKGISVPRSIISHVVRNRMDQEVPLDIEILTDVLKNNSLPRPAEQANNFITYLGGYLSSPGDLYDTLAQQTSSIHGLLGLKIGTAEQSDLQFIIDALVRQNIVSIKYGKTIDDQEQKASLTLEGWQKYEELRRSVKDSRKAFVAMEFASLERINENYFFQTTLLDKYLIPAVKKTGYDLANSLRSEPKAGNIHARLEVEIRASRFIVAELSHHNNGAYWEAGFARGLGKPVIYMFNKAIAKSERPPHFDVGSDLYIPWEEEKPDKAADDLKAVVRATLFGEAMMED
jgi:hypothetical protein